MDQTISLAHSYKNELVALEHWRRNALEEILGEDAKLEAADALVEELDGTLTAVRDVISRRNAALKRRTGTAEDREQVASLRWQLADARSIRKEIRRTAFEDPVLLEAVKAMEKEVRARGKQLRGSYTRRGLAWGSYLDTENTMQLCRRQPELPHFWSWDGGSGRVAVQIQNGGLKLEDAWSGHGTSFRLSPLPDDMRGGGAFPLKSARWHLARMRIGSDEKRRPIWVSFPVVLRRDLLRELHPTARIKWAFLIRKRDAAHNPRRLRGVRGSDLPRVSYNDTWQLLLSVDDSAGFDKRWTPGKDGAVGIDVGGRLVPGGLRVAAWVGDDGRSEELIIPTERSALWEDVKAIQSERDINFNVIRDRLVGWLDGRRDLPTWLVEDTEALRQWRSPRRLASVTLAWRDGWTDREGVYRQGRFAGDGEILSHLEKWRRLDRKLRHARQAASAGPSPGGTSSTACSRLGWPDSTAPPW